MIINTSFLSKETRLEPKPCFVDKTIVLPYTQFQHFKSHLMEDYDFLLENQNSMGATKDGMIKGLLVLSDQGNDGILVNSEGSSYARYTAYIPNAKLQHAIDRYSFLGSFVFKMSQMVDVCADRIVRGQADGKYLINIPNLKKEFDIPKLDEDLFVDMLSERTEFTIDGFYDNEIHCSLKAEYAISEGESNLRVYSPLELKMLLAKHFLWLNGDESGQQLQLYDAYFEKETFEGVDLSSAVIKNCKFVDCNFYKGTMCFSEVTGTKFCNCMMMDLTAEEANFHQAEFRHCIMDGGVYTHANFHQAKFVQSDIRNMTFMRACVAETEFIETNTDNANMDYSFSNIEGWDGNEAYCEMRME